jgi:recombination protein RecA
MEHLNDKIKIAMASLEKEFGKNTVVQLGNVEIEPIEYIETGSPTLDDALGLGGVPRGRIVEIYGGESAGKSSLALSIVAEAQKDGLVCAYVDAEHAMDLVYAKSLKVDVDSLLFSQPTTGEEALSIVNTLARTGAIGLIVVDSVAALTPKAELEGHIGQSHVGLLPRLMAQSLRIMTGELSKTGTTVIFINQIREKIGVMFGNPETQPGGRALKFYASVRIELRKNEVLKDANGEVNGVRTKAKVIKNKVGPPLREAFFNIYYGEGIDKMMGLAELAIDKGIIKKKGGGWMSYNDESIAQGDQQLAAKLQDEPDFYNEIHELVFGEGNATEQ